MDRLVTLVMKNRCTALLNLALNNQYMSGDQIRWLPARNDTVNSTDGGAYKFK